MGDKVMQPIKTTVWLGVVLMAGSAGWWAGMRWGTPSVSVVVVERPVLPRMAQEMALLAEPPEIPAPPEGVARDEALPGDEEEPAGAAGTATPESDDADLEEQEPPPPPPPEAMLREVLVQQGAFELPHELEHYEASVIRLEPDGLHLRHAGGIVKIEIEGLPEELRAKYHIHPATAELYRALVARRMEEVAQETARRRAAEREEAEAREWERRGAREADREEAARAAARAWAEYDYEMDLYRQRSSEILWHLRQRPGRPGGSMRVHVHRRPPQPPPYPRPRQDTPGRDAGSEPPGSPIQLDLSISS